MAKIRIDLKEPFLDGMDIKFKAPCDCTAIDGMIVYYPLDDDSGTGSQTFVFKDAHGNILTGLGNLFTKDAVVKVVVDRSTSSAYIQNAATNKYLEDKIANAGSKVTLSSSVTSTSTTTAANSYAVKQAYDKANAAAGVEVGDFNVTSTVGGLTLTKQYAKYVKVGRLVFFRCAYQFSYAGNSSGGTTLGTNGLPLPDKGTDEFGAAINTSLYGKDGSYWTHQFDRMAIWSTGIGLGASYSKDITAYTAWGCYISAS